MNRFRNTNIVKIPYREGKISKQLSLNLNNEHDARFYESYDKIPLDNRNYLASLYAREQERGVNDDVGQRLQDLALETPKEDIVITRERRKIDLESLEKSLKDYNKEISELESKKERVSLSADEESKLNELKKIREDIKRRIRNLKSAALKSEMSDVISKNGIRGANSLTKDGFKEALNNITDIMSQNVIKFLDDKIEQLPAKADGEDGSEQYALLAAGFLGTLYKLLDPTADITKLATAIKKIYILLESIKKDTLTESAWDNYKESVEYVIEMLNLFDNFYIPDSLQDSKIEVTLKQMAPTVTSLWFVLGRAIYMAYTEAQKKNLPRWNTIKGYLDGDDSFMLLYNRGKSEYNFNATDEFTNAKSPYEVLKKGLTSAGEKIHKTWKEALAKRGSLSYKINELNSKVYRNAKPATMDLEINYDAETNTLHIIHFALFGTNLNRPLQNVYFDEWLTNPRSNTSTLTFKQKSFGSDVATKVLRELGMTSDGYMPPEIFKDITSEPDSNDEGNEGSGAQYRSFKSPEQQFHNIIDMGNPLKAIRSRRRR